MIFYRICELMLAILIQRYDKKKKEKIISVLSQFKKERLTEILQDVRCHIFYDCINPCHAE